jgi:hypothetical protein
VAIQLVICLGDLKNLWEKGWFCYSKREYPPHWEIQREILFYNEIWLSHKILSMFYLEHCFLFVQLIELLCAGICFILPMWEKIHVNWEF